MSSIVVRLIEQRVGFDGEDDPVRLLANYPKVSESGVKSARLARVASRRPLEKYLNAEWSHQLLIFSHSQQMSHTVDQAAPRIPARSSKPERRSTAMAPHSDAMAAARSGRWPSAVVLLFAG
jgi:hypothetical protein